MFDRMETASVARDAAARERERERENVGLEYRLRVATRCTTSNSPDSELPCVVAVAAPVTMTAVKTENPFTRKEENKRKGVLRASHQN
jgi:hypothetical protein